MHRRRGGGTPPRLDRPPLGNGGGRTRYSDPRAEDEYRADLLGHVQLGGTPTAYDRVLATRYGLAAVDSVIHSRWGRMVSLSGTTITHVAFEDALGKLNTVPQDRYDEAAILFG